MKFELFTGKRFGRLLVLSDDKVYLQRRTCTVVCDCGVKKTMLRSSLTAGAKSCGCLTKEVHTKHGLYGTPEYNTWSSMIARCLKPQSTTYHKYGGRGITVCERWKDIHNFIEDMGPRPKGTSIERINNNGNYEPGNCRWATSTEQGRNKRNNNLITAFGETHTASYWAEKLGTNKNLVYVRIRQGFSPEEAVTIPVRKHKEYRSRRD